MKRKIITTITFSSGRVSISAIEQLPSNTVEIFNNSSDISKATTFVSTSLSHIEKLIGGKVSKVSFIVKASPDVDGVIDIKKESIQIVGDNVTSVDIDNILSLIKTKNNDESRRAILVHPLKFEVHDIMTKSYSRAPIHKKGNKLSVVASVTTISRKVYEYILQVARAANVEVAQIMLSNQASAFANLSQNALASGSILLHIGEDQADISINKNNSTVAYMSLYKFGFKYLIKGIVKEMNCSEKTARDLLSAHADLKIQKNRVIYTNQIGSENWSYTNKDLETILRKYFTTLVALTKKYISQKKVDNLPLVISGKMNKIMNIKDYISMKMESERVILYKPMTFIEKNELNMNSIGMLKFIDIMDMVLGKHFDTIVHTNPSSLRVIRASNEPKGLFAKLKQKIGGKYEWN